MAKVARGKALVAKLRADPKVRDAEALAAELGRRKKLRQAAKKAKEKIKDGIGKVSKTNIPDDDDPFAEDFGDDPLSEEELAQQKYEAKILRDIEKDERSRLHSIVHETGGLKTRDSLREEYSEIPNTFKRKDGLPGDEMAEYLSSYYPEFGIEDERDLIDYLAS